MNIIFKAIVGSHAYGTNIEGSDTDIKGVYIQSPEDVLQNGYREQVTITDDEVYYELRRFIDLCCTNNPGMLELLFSPEDCILVQDPVFDIILQNREKFLSKSCRHSYGGYAYEQIEKAAGLKKKMNWEKEKTVRKTVLDFCYVVDPYFECNSLPVKDWLKREGFDQKYCGLSAIDHFRFTYNLFYDYTEDLVITNPRFKPYNFSGIISNEETSNDVCLSSIPKDAKRGAIMYFNKDGYSSHCNDYKSYETWLKERNTQRYVDVDQHGQKIDGKNLLHCIRLIETGKEIAEQGVINVRRPNAEYLIGIRKGKFDLKSLVDEARLKIDDMKKAFDSCNLPDKIDRGYWLALIPKIRKQFYDKTL